MFLNTPAFKLFFNTTAATISISPFLIAPGAFKSGKAMLIKSFPTGETPWNPSFAI